MSAVDVITTKRDGGRLSDEQVDWVVAAYTRGDVADEQMAALAMAILLNGMDAAETARWTAAMIDSGERLALPDVGRPLVDKHSTGGVGDKITLPLAPLVAACGAAVPQLSGRGLGHTGGTLDKLESIPGFAVHLSLDQIRAQVGRIGCALVGQSPELVPADGALYALRDVTGTVDSMPLIASSIMSKKLAGGARAVVLDVKWGSGAFMTSLEVARTLARMLVRIGQGAGRATRAVLSGMRQPLGRAVGNALEVREAIDTLAGGGPDDLWALTLELGAHLLEMSGLARDADEGRATLTRLRDSGAGADMLETLVEAQHGDPRVVRQPELLPAAPVVRAFTVDEDGPRWVEVADARGIGDAALALGAGRKTKADQVDPAVGIVLRARIGDRVHPGQPLADVHARSDEAAEAAFAALRAAFRLSTEPVPAADEPYETVG